MEFLSWVEQLGLSTWVREGGSWYGYALILFIHTMGMALVVGCVAFIDLRLLGYGAPSAIRPLERLFPFIWVGFALSLTSGVILIMADATIKLTNPLIYLKLALIAAGLVTLRMTRTKVFGGDQIDRGELPGAAKGLAWASLFCWLAALTAGRLLAYIGPVAGLA
jgi:hypothetical protein